MAGLTGIYRIRGEEGESGLFSRMCDSITHSEGMLRQTFEDEQLSVGRVSLGILNPEEQPIYNEDRSALIVMEGEVFGYEELKSELEARGHAFTVNNDAEFVLHMYEEYGRDFAGKLNGSFLAVVYDLKKKELLLVNDRVGSLPVYFWTGTKQVLFATEVKAILESERVERVVDDASVMDYFTHGYMLGDKTFIRGIKLLSYGSMLVLSGEGLILKHYWSPKYEEEESMSDEEYSERLKSLLAESVERQLGGGHILGVSLSGGFDSRVISGLARRMRPELRLPQITFAYDLNCDDARIARKVSKRLGVENMFIRIRPDYLADLAVEGVRLTDGQSGLTFMHVLGILDELKSCADVHIKGVLLDAMLRPSAIRRAFFWSDNRLFDHTIMGELNIGLIPNPKEAVRAMDGDYYSKHEHCLEESFRQVAARGLPDNIYRRCCFLVMTERERRFIFELLNIIRKKAEIRMPWADNDLYDFYLTVPPRLIYDGSLAYNTAKSLLPSLSRIPMTATLAPVGAKRWEAKIYYLADKARRAIDYMITKLSFGRINRIRKRNFYAYDTWIRREKRVREFFEGILFDEKTLKRGYFNPEGLKQLWEEHLSGAKNHSIIFGLIASFELYNREFIDSQA